MKAKITSDKLVLSSWGIPAKYAGEIVEGKNEMSKGGIDAFFFEKQSYGYKYAIPVSEVALINKED